MPKIRPRRAVDITTDHLRSLIISGEYPTDSLLPPERRLAEELGVNRLTLRAALARLEAEKLVVPRQGQGIRVQDWRRTGGLSLLSGVDDDQVIVPVAMTNIWMRHSQFPHGSHSAQRCAECHPTAAVYSPSTPGMIRPAASMRKQVPYGLSTPQELLAETNRLPSEHASDIMLPGQDKCRSCHDSVASRNNRVSTPCVDCHDFHEWKNRFGNPYR